MCAKFDDSSFSRSRDIFRGTKIYSGSRDADHAPSKGDLSFWFWNMTQPVYKIWQL